jgi:hypothetical protein
MLFLLNLSRFFLPLKNNLFPNLFDYFKDCGIELKKHNVATVGLLIGKFNYYFGFFDSIKLRILTFIKQGTVKTESTLRVLEERGDVRIPLDPNNPLFDVCQVNRTFSVSIKILANISYI